jgi:transcriptional regulator with XRE-family HTH domain
MKGMPGLRFRDRLQDAFAERRLKNRRYSLRAFARLLATDHATLSQILRGSRRIPARQLSEWAIRLGLQPEEIAAYEAAEQLPDPQTALEQERLRQWIAEASAVMARPEHLAILELIRTAEFQPDSRWIAERAGVTVDQINIALSRLLRLRLIALPPGGKWRDLTGLARLSPSEFRKIALARVRELAQKEGDNHAASSDAIPDSFEKPRRNRALLRRPVRLEDRRRQSARLPAD